MPKDPDASSAAAAGASPASPRHAPLGFTQFVSLIAALMALNALAIDIILPGFPEIERSFALDDPNQAQTVISTYLLGFGLGQLAMGVLSDWYGRRPVLLAGIFVYALASVACLLAPSMTALLIARFVQGLGSAAPRVVAVAAVRDCYGGRRMARVMSLVMMVFMMVPVLAPSIGQLILIAASWHAVFAFLAIYAFLAFGFCLKLLPETLHPEWKRPIRVPIVAQGLRSIFGSRQTVGYMLSAGAFFAALFGFINSAQQILGEVLGLGQWFPLVFMVAAGSIALAAFVNSRLVERLGMRVLSHAAMLFFLGLSLVFLLLASLDLVTAWVFVPILTCSMLLVGLVFANFNALAMEPQQEVAGIASSVIGAVTVLCGAGGGYLIGQAFDGSVLPLAVGFVISGAVTLVMLLIAERGRLCQPLEGRTPADPNA